MWSKFFLFCILKGFADKTRHTVQLWLIYSCAAVFCWQELVWVGRASLIHTHAPLPITPPQSSLILISYYWNSHLALPLVHMGLECSRKPEPRTTESILEPHCSKKTGSWHFERKDNNCVNYKFRQHNTPFLLCINRVSWTHNLSCQDHGVTWLSYTEKIPTQQELDSGKFIDSKKRFLLAHTWFDQLTVSLRCAGAEMPLNHAEQDVFILFSPTFSLS